jgi:hypothetical protein
MKLYAIVIVFISCLAAAQAGSAKGRLLWQVETGG